MANEKSESAGKGMGQSRRAILLAAPFAVALVQGALGCASPRGIIKAGDTSKISVGMSRSDVTTALGAPESTSADGPSETMTYLLDRAWFRYTKFRVMLMNGKVQSYE